MDVEFLPYVNLYNGKNYGNRSYFAGVNFINDINYTFSNTPQHVYIDGCTGISFWAVNSTIIIQ